MYNFIVNLFTEEDYNALLNEDESEPKNETTKILIVPPNLSDSPFVISGSDIEEEVNDILLLEKYPLVYFTSKFVRPTRKGSNNIGSNSALLSHSPTHYKLTNVFFDKNEDNINRQHPNGNVVIKIPSKKVDSFRDSVKKTEYYNQFPNLCDRVESFFRNFDTRNPENTFGLRENDLIVFLVNESDIDSYIATIEEYTLQKILKYNTFEGNCDSCGELGQLYMLTFGNIFDLAKDRKFLLRHPTRFKSNLKSKSSENFNLCEKCSKQIYDYFEYIKKYKFYRYVFPTTVTVETSDYRDYSSDPIGILKMLKSLYDRNRSQEFDYVMMIANPKLEDIEFTYVNNFNYYLQNIKPTINIKDISIHSTLKELPDKNKKGAIRYIQNERDKSIFLRELNLIFNNNLIGSLFEKNPKKLRDTLHPFLKLKIIEYNSIIRNFLYFQDVSLFEDCIYSKLFREMLSELITNSGLRDDMKIGPNKIRFFLTIYYKYLNIEPNGGETITEYMALKEKMKDNDSFEIENDFEASYCMGQAFYYLVQEYKGKNKLNLFTKYTMNVHNMDMLKKKLISVLEKYSHNEYLDNNRRFHNLTKNVLAFEFKKSYEDNKISLYTGYFDDNYLYSSTKEKEERESTQQEDN
ncbi:hypothetical protein J7W08_04855 [Methanococcoides orientis]|uniref:hypothetical protein n=1 Tax=Methanococcoides orientis TaxID=2822137 RepID=UPI001E2A0B20|nr:hypothetical protein [Methanococcoides orientis]UGV41619.1 hypothetical protein J7W08_04855 [Methanococcoides orientis]